MIRYQFSFEDGYTLSFVFDEDRDISPDVVEGPVPEWMLLENNKCDECTLPPGSRRTCPAAVAIRPIIEGFEHLQSFETAHVKAQVRHITLESNEPVQRTVRSLMALALPLSSCPILCRTRPLAYVHVPFATREYEAFRVLGMHFIEQYLRAQDGKSPDWELTRLLEALRIQRRVLATLAHRIRAAGSKDASVNSLLLLDAIADSIELTVERSLKSLRPLFRERLAPPADGKG